MDQLFRFLESVQPLSAEASELLANMVEVRVLPKGHELQSVGKTCRTIYFLTRGSARIFYFKDGTDVTENFEFAPALVVRAESLFTGMPSKKGIQLLQDSEVVALPSARVIEAYDRFPEIERLFRLLYERAWVTAIHRIESLQFRSASERYDDLLRESPEVVQTIPLKLIASYLGITPVSLSRIRARR